MESDNVDVASEKDAEYLVVGGKDSMEIHRLSVDTATLAYAIFGSGKIDMVIEMGLGAVIGRMVESGQTVECASYHFAV